MMLTIVAALQSAALPIPSSAEPAAANVSVQTVQFVSPPLVLAQDTPIELMATSEVNTNDATPGTIFKLRVNRAVEVGGRVVVPVGTPAFGEVLTARDAGGLGKSGRMTARLLHMRVGDIEVPLEGQTSAKGTGAGSTAAAVIFGGWMGLFHRGNNAKIKAGEILNGYVAKATQLGIMPLGVSAVPAALPVVAPAATPSSVPAAPSR